MKSLHETGTLVSAFILSLSSAPVYGADLSYLEKLAEHEEQYSHVMNPHELDGPPLYERTWYLIGAVYETEGRLDRVKLDRRLDTILEKRLDALCNPMVSSLFSLYVKARYLSECSTDEDDDWSSHSFSVAAKPIVATWFDEDGSEGSISQEQTILLTDEARRGSGILVVDTGSDLAVVGRSGEWIVDWRFSASTMAGLGIIRPGGSPTIEDVLKLGLALNDPANVGQLELLGIAAPGQTLATLQLAHLLLGIPKFAELCGMDPDTAPVDVSAALRVIEAKQATPDALIRYETMAKQYPDLGNPLLPLALASHPSELEGLRIVIDVGNDEPIALRKLRPEEIDGWVIRPNKRTTISPADIRGFEIIEKRR